MLIDEPTNQQRRVTAKEKLAQAIQYSETQQHKLHLRKRNSLIAFITTVLVIIFAGGAYLWNQHIALEKRKATYADCSYSTLSDDSSSPGHNVGIPAKGWVNKITQLHVTFNTSQGKIPVTLDRHLAPCGVHSVEYLIQKKYYNNTSCHREVISKNMTILQCGAATPDGSADAGYVTSPNEMPTNLLNPTDPIVIKKFAHSIDPAMLSKLQYAAHAKFYPLGTIALAGGSDMQGNPFVSGSEFFFVTGNTILPPLYPILGHVDPAGLPILAKITAEGISPYPPSAHNPPPSKDEGRPKVPVKFLSVTIQGK